MLILFNRIFIEYVASFKCVGCLVEITLGVISFRNGVAVVTVDGRIIVVVDVA